eukprot:snap_masked-scaffold954_size76946-processed-gene-0.4 protein:Tk12144 transcript:snap_masked-scaffold954_size76946-processed-gene-0.4-mRNA-1 annotation:"carboxypeptidase b"
MITSRMAFDSASENGCGPWKVSWQIELDDPLVAQAASKLRFGSTPMHLGLVGCSPAGGAPAPGENGYPVEAGGENPGNTAPGQNCLRVTASSRCQLLLQGPLPFGLDLDGQVGRAAHGVLRSTILPPHSIEVPGVFIAVGVGDRNDVEVKRLEQPRLSVGQELLDGVDAECGRDPLSGVNAAFHEYDGLVTARFAAQLDHLNGSTLVRGPDGDNVHGLATHFLLLNLPQMSCDLVETIVVLGIVIGLARVSVVEAIALLVLLEDGLHFLVNGRLQVVELDLVLDIPLVQEVLEDFVDRRLDGETYGLLHMGRLGPECHAHCVDALQSLEVNQLALGLGHNVQHLDIVKICFAAPITSVSGLIRMENLHALGPGSNGRGDDNQCSQKPHDLPLGGFRLTSSEWQVMRLLRALVVIASAIGAWAKSVEVLHSDQPGYAGDGGGKADFDNVKVLDIVPKTQGQLIDLQRLESIDAVGVAFWSEPAHVEETVSLSVEPTVYKILEDFLNQRDIQHEVKFDNLQTAIDEEMKSVLKEDEEGDGLDYRDPSKSYYDAQNYNRLNQITAHLREIQEQEVSGQAMNIVSIGTTYEGRPIEMVKLSGEASGNQPIIFMECGIHAREWVSPAFCVHTIKELLADGESGLLKSFDFYIVPVSNPDGYEYSWNFNRMWRKNRRPQNAMSSTTHLPIQVESERKRSLEEELALDIEADYTQGVSEHHNFTREDAVTLKQFWPGAVFPGFSPPASTGYPFSPGAGAPPAGEQPTNPKCIGVDPNRNFDAAWATKGSSNSICQDTFHGPQPFSEAESKAIRDVIIGGQASGKTFAAFLSVHAYSQFWMSPYGYKKSRSSHYSDQIRVMKKAVEALSQVYGTQFKQGPINEVIYQAAGSSVDWAYDNAGIKYSYALELRDAGQYGFLLPVQQIAPTNKETYSGLQAMGWEIAKEFS